MNEDRPNPDELLKAISFEEKSKHRGRLKVFLGMAAGVGKTYAMLEDAHKLVKEGYNVVVGIVNTHGRKETEELLQGLTIIPEKLLSYKGSTLEELDLETILTLKPDVVLVDELAHSNVPGSRHPKRWQDVEELLDNGIDVSTTVNVQHIESLKEIIETIAGITIRETVPDSIIESAASIEMIDLTPKELLQRLKEGKVYIGDQAEVARVNFFQEDRLTALREIVLRFAAEKVDHDLRGMVSTIERASGWKPRERLLVAISHSPHSQKLIRTTRRLAFALNAPWIAVHVDTGKALEAEDTQMLVKNLTLARDLGAEVITTQDPDIAVAIERIARQKQATQIIVGRSPRKPFLGLWKRKSLIDRLATDCEDLDIHVIRQAPHVHEYKRKKPLKPAAIAPYFAILCWVWLFTLINMLIEPYVGYKVIGFLFLLGISVLSLFYTKGPVFFGAILYGISWDYFFIPPVGTFSMANEDNNMLLGLYVLTAIVTGILTDRARVHKDMLAKREESSHALYEIVRLISSSPSSSEIVQAVKAQLEAVLNGNFEFLIKRPENGLSFEEGTDPKEKATATWVFENDKEAGWSTDTLAASKYLYIPLRGYKDIVGVLTFRPHEERPLTFQEKNFLYTAGQQLAYYLERRFTEEQERQKELLEQVERIYDQMLKSFTPTRDAALDTMSSVAKMGGRIAPQHMEQCDIKAIIEESIQKMQAQHTSHLIKVTLDNRLPKMRLDQAQIELLLGNLLTNAIQTSPSGSHITTTATFSNNNVYITIEHPGDSSNKDVWGIAVAKVIARAHKGSLQQESLQPHGTRFSLRLPVSLLP